VRIVIGSKLLFFFLKVKPPLAKWKFHRWLKWAISRNMIDLADFVPIRYLKVISPLKECNSIGHDKSDVAGNLIFSNEIEKSDKFTRRMRSQETSDLPTASKEEAKEDVNRWIDFNKLASYVTEVYLFYKLEYFQQSIQVTDDVLKIASENHNKSETANAASIKETEKEKAGILLLKFLSKKILSKRILDKELSGILLNRILDNIYC